MKNCWTILIAIFITSTSAFCQPQEIHSKHFFKGYPLGSPTTNDLIIRNLYALSNNDSTKFADWVAYRLDSTTISGQDRNRNWNADPWLEEDETLELDDYSGAFNDLETDRGHQAPLGSLDGPDSYYETNYLSNITPQKFRLNRFPWRDLETRERRFIEDGIADYIIVYTGLLYERDIGTLPGADEPHTIPSGYWKIIIVPSEDDTFETVAFIFDQDTPTEGQVIDHLVTINEIENRSGLDFFWEMSASEQEEFENDNNGDWGQQFFD